MFERPWGPVLPLAIPATPWSLNGARPLTVNGFAGGRLLVSTANGRSVALGLDDARRNDSPQLVRFAHRGQAVRTR